MKDSLTALTRATRGAKTVNRAEFDRLNALQAGMWLAGQTHTPEYQAIQDQMWKIAPPEYTAPGSRR